MARRQNLHDSDQTIPLISEAGPLTLPLPTVSPAGLRPEYVC